MRQELVNEQKLENLQIFLDSHTFNHLTIDEFFNLYSLHCQQFVENMNSNFKAEEVEEEEEEWNYKFDSQPEKFKDNFVNRFVKYLH